MNGNTPYGGLPGQTNAGQRAAADVPTLSATQKRLLHRDVSRIADRTREFLPDEYVVDAEVSTGISGPRVTVAVRPPVGHAVSAGFTPNVDDVTDEPESKSKSGTGDDLISDDECTEVARGLAASAALQMKQALSDGIRPTGK